MKCKICGDIVDHDNFMDDYAIQMREEKLCFSCVLWKRREKLLKDDKDHSIAIIDGTYYTIGDEDSKEYFRGFGGARFQIEFNDGHRVVSTNLWCGGDVPAKWQDKLPNNAKFERNFKWKKIGECKYLFEDEII